MGGLFVLTRGVATSFFHVVARPYTVKRRYRKMFYAESVARMLRRGGEVGYIEPAGIFRIRRSGIYDRVAEKYAKLSRRLKTSCMRPPAAFVSVKNLTRHTQLKVWVFAFGAGACAISITTKKEDIARAFFEGDAKIMLRRRRSSPDDLTKSLLTSLCCSLHEYEAWGLLEDLRFVPFTAFFVVEGDADPTGIISVPENARRLARRKDDIILVSENCVICSALSCSKKSKRRIRMILLDALALATAQKATLANLRFPTNSNEYFLREVLRTTVSCLYPPVLLRAINPRRGIARRSYATFSAKASASFPEKWREVLTAVLSATDDPKTTETARKLSKFLESLSTRN